MTTTSMAADDGGAWRLAASSRLYGTGPRLLAVCSSIVASGLCTICEIDGETLCSTRVSYAVGRVVPRSARGDAGGGGKGEGEVVTRPT